MARAEHGEVGGLRRLFARRRDRVVGTLIRPIDGATSLHRRGAEPELRLLLFGSGPATGWGVHLQDLGLGGGIVDGVAKRTGRAVTLDLLVDETWQDPDAVTALRAQRLSAYDAIVSIGSYRDSLLEVPLPALRAYLERVRDVLIEEAGPDVVIQVLSLPWDDAMQRVPEVWGGTFGEVVMTMVQIQDETFDGVAQIIRMDLQPPVEASEWVGPDFSVASYARWSAAVTDRLAPLLTAPTGGSAR